MSLLILFLLGSLSFEACSFEKELTRGKGTDFSIIQWLETTWYIQTRFKCGLKSTWVWLLMLPFIYYVIVGRFFFFFLSEFYLSHLFGKQGKLEGFLHFKVKVKCCLSAPSILSVPQLFFRLGEPQWNEIMSWRDYRKRSGGDGREENGR